MKKRRMGKLICVTAALLLALSLAACGGGETASEPCEWPDSEIGKLLPETTAEATELSFDEDYIYADLKMTKDEYKEYVKACREAGFTVEESYSESSDSCYFSAENADKYYLSIMYDPSKKIADLSLDAPVDEEAEAEEEEQEQEQEQQEKKEQEKPKEKKSDSGSSVSADFKKTMDDYESFMNDYVDFMKKYEDSDDVSAMLEDYSSMMDKYAKFEKKIDAIDEDELSSADYAYYTKVMGRVTEKLAEMY